MPFVKLQPLTAEAFAHFGQVLGADTCSSDFLINNGNCRRYHDLCAADTSDENGETILSLFRAKPFNLPMTVSLFERHPLGSQAFMPLSGKPWLAIVAEDDAGKPGVIRAFLAEGNQGVQYAKNIWHVPLSPLETEADFLVMDRKGPGNNLEEFYLPEPIIVEA